MVCHSDFVTKLTEESQVREGSCALVVPTRFETPHFTLHYRSMQFGIIYLPL